MSSSIYPSYPLYPGFPGIPTIPDPGAMPSTPNMPSLPSLNPAIGPGTSDTTLKGTFVGMLQGVTREMQTPYQVAQEMATGQRPFDTADLMISILEAERKLNVTVRVINELIKGLKQLEAVQI